MDHKKAMGILNDSLAQLDGFKSNTLSDQDQEAIRGIILGGHLTFRYLLMTALLAKVVDPEIHMRSLQAKSELSGAYDARSLCHGVWVHFERDRFDGCLGGSNEPFVNKPARFPEISLKNPVRAGKDKKSLVVLHSLLNRLNTMDSETHREGLLFAMQMAKNRPKMLASPLISLATPLRNLTCEAVWSVLDEFLEQGHHGEAAVSVTTAVLRRLFIEPNVVRAHPANQSGASSNETGDVEILNKSAIILAVEVKDKLFSLPDIEQAAAKAAGVGKLWFVYGRHACPINSETINAATENFESRGLDLTFAAIDELVYMLIGVMNRHQRCELLKSISSILVEMRAKDVTQKHFNNCLSKLFP